MHHLLSVSQKYKESTFSEGGYRLKKASGIFFKNKKILRYQFDIDCYNNNFLCKVEIFSFFKYLLLLFQVIDVKSYLHHDQILWINDFFKTCNLNIS